MTLTEARVREPLRAALQSRTPIRAVGPGTAAAVLVPLFERQGEVHVWLLRRTETMRSHAGQVAFPGGKRDSDDTSLLVTALRETEEELGFDRGQVDALGALDDLITGTGYVVTPWVGWVPGELEPVPHPAEVARVFSAPLRRFVYPHERRRGRETPGPDGHSNPFGYSVDGELVWGATAAMASALGALVRSVMDPPIARGG